MIKYTILYKNGKTWNGKVKSIGKIPVTDCTLMVASYKLGLVDQREFQCIFVPKRGILCNYWCEFSGWYETKALVPRKPNPKSKTKAQKKFEEAYNDWFNTQRVVYWADGSIKAYKKWLWEQKNEKAVKVDQDGFIPWNGGECPVQHNIKVDLRFRDGEQNSSKSNAGCYCWKHYGSRSDIIAYKVYEEKLPASEKPDIYKAWKDASLDKYKMVLYTSKPPIKTTYTFWLGVNGEIIDDK